MNQYELTYIRKLGADPEKFKKLEARFTKAFEKHGGEILGLQDLGEKTMAYPIKKEPKGHYVQVDFIGTGALVDEIEGLFRISAEILRFLTIRLGRDIDVEKAKKDYEEKKAAPPPPAAEEASDKGQEAAAVS